MQEKLVSIIVPTYNSEKTIKQSLNSLINQTYKNLEIIVVNDGSIDNTFKIIENIKDKRIRLFSQENKGVSFTRNLGLEKAKGEFILFVDSDDYVEENMVEELIKYASYECIVFSNTFVKEKNKEYELKLFNNIKGDIDKELAMKEIVSGGAGLVCSKLISTKIIKDNNIVFNDKLILGEDQVFFLEVAKHAKKFKYIDKAFYYYDRTDESSATNKYHKGLIDNFIILQNEVVRNFNEEGINTKENKVFLNNKIKKWFWNCIDNEVRNIKKIGIKGCIKNIGNILDKVKEIIELENIEVCGIVDKVMCKSIRFNNKLSSLKLIIIAKLIIIKNG